MIATPASAAQEVAETLVAAGVRSILNFAPGILTVPDDVEVRHVDLSLELQILAFHESRRVADLPDGPRPEPLRPESLRSDGSRSAEPSAQVATAFPTKSITEAVAVRS